MSNRTSQNFELPYINLQRIEEIRSKYECCCCRRIEFDRQNYLNTGCSRIEDDYVGTRGNNYCECDINDINDNFYKSGSRNRTRSCINHELNRNSNFNSESIYNKLYISTPIRRKETIIDESECYSSNRNNCESCNKYFRDKIVGNIGEGGCRRCQSIYSFHRRDCLDENKNCFEMDENISDPEYINNNTLRTVSVKKFDELSDLEDNQEITINRNNRKIINLALNWISLSGEHNKKVRKFVIDSMESQELINIPHFVILFQYDDHKGVRGIYTYSKEDNHWYCVIEIASNCPKIIDKEMIHTLYRFDTCQKLFKPIKQSKKITDIVDGLSIKNEYLTIIDN